MPLSFINRNKSQLSEVWARMILFYNFHLNFISLICTRSLIWFVLGKVVRSTDFCSNAIRFLAGQISITHPSARCWNITHIAATCETALLSLTDNWLKAMDNSKLVGLVFLDLSKAFDLVSHDILLSKIAKYHTSKQPLRWFRSYLCDRTTVSYTHLTLPTKRIV